MNTLFLAVAMGVCVGFGLGWLVAIYFQEDDPACQHARFALRMADRALAELDTQLTRETEEVMP